MIKYVEANGMEKLELLVNKMAEDGWHLVGTPIELRDRFYQTMEKTHEKNTKTLTTRRPIKKYSSSKTPD